MIDYDRAVAIWISNQTGDDPDLIHNIDFGTIQHGYCETCEYTTMGITYSVKKPGHKYPMSAGVTMLYPPAQFIREVSEIIQGGGKIGTENATADQE